MRWIVVGPPAGPGVQLASRPQVLSWDKAGSWSQKRLVPYQAEIQRTFSSSVSAPISFDLHCGLSGAGNLEFAGDLDNFLYPVAEALGWGNVVAGWGSKALGSSSFLAVGPATAATLDEQYGWLHRTARTTRSAGTVAWKQELAAQISGVSPAPGQFVELVIAFDVGPGRAWRNLWKPTIDSLAAILGEGPRLWHPRDGRVSRLGLSLSVNPEIGHDVLIHLWWRGVAALAVT